MKTRADAVAVAALTGEAVETADRELEAHPRGPRLRGVALAVDGGLRRSLRDALLGRHFE